MSAVEIVIAIAEGLKKRGISMESMDMLPRVVEHTLNLSITEGFNFKEQAEQLQAELESLREQLAAAQSERDEWISLAGEYAKFNSELHTQPPGTPEGMRVKQLGARYSSRADGTVFMMAELEPLSPSAESAKPMEDARHE